MIDCTGLNKSEVFVHLYNNAKPLGMGFFQAKSQPMELNEASTILSTHKYVDYIYGRPMKMNFDAWPMIDPQGYDRDQGGTGTAARLINELRSTGNILMKSIELPSNHESNQIQKQCSDSIKIVCASGETESYESENEPCYCLSKYDDLKNFNTVHFTKKYSDLLKKKGIPYPYDWHVFMGKNDIGEYTFVGFMGGSFTVPGDLPCVKTISHATGI